MISSFPPQLLLRKFPPIQATSIPGNVPLWLASRFRSISSIQRKVGPQPCTVQPQESRLQTIWFGRLKPNNAWQRGRHTHGCIEAVRPRILKHEPHVEPFQCTKSINGHEFFEEFNAVHLCSLLYRCLGQCRQIGQFQHRRRVARIGFLFGSVCRCFSLRSCFCFVLLCSFSSSFNSQLVIRSRCKSA